MRFFYFLVAILFISCNEAKQIQKAKNRLSTHPLEAAEFCGTLFPVKERVIYRDSITLDTIYQEGEVVTDTLYKHDTTIIIRTSPNKIVTKTITKYKEVQVENTAKLQEKEKLYIDCEKRYHDLYTKLELTDAERKSWKSKFWWILFVAIGAIIGYLTKQPWWATLVKQLQKQIKK